MPGWPGQFYTLNIALKSIAYGILTLQCTMLVGLAWMTMVKALTGREISSTAVTPAVIKVGCRIGMFTVPCYLYFTVSQIRDEKVESKPGEDIDDDANT